MTIQVSLLFIAFSIFHLSILSLGQDHGAVVTLDLIHRDSPASPLYNPSETHWQRMSNALLRSRHKKHRYGLKALTLELISGGFEYLVNISIGTPPRNLIGIVDTGSDLIWTQCKPCNNCFKQKPPLFDPALSPTYKALSCSSKNCHFLKRTSCSSSNFCDYTYRYGDGSYTTGTLSLDTITLGSLSVPGVTFGCGHKNGGVFSGIESGIVGLGSGAVSLVTQLGKSVGGRFFSHCLVPTETDPKFSSKMYFGGKVAGRGVVSTPLLTNGSQPFYYLELQGMSVGAENFTFDVSRSQAFKGNIIIDCGTTITFLPADLYDKFEAKIRKEVHLEVVKSPGGPITTNLCYKTKSDIFHPTVTVHFNGAHVQLTPVNTFLRVSEDVVCLAFLPTSDVGIYGNVAVTNFLVGYDLENKFVSFKSTDCTTN